MLHILIADNFDDIARFAYARQIGRYCEAITVESLAANEAKTHFGDMLLTAQRAPVQIKKNGKPIVVLISTEEYQSIEVLKLRLLQARVVQANAHTALDNLIDGESFFSESESGLHD